MGGMKQEVDAANAGVKVRSLGRVPYLGLDGRFTLCKHPPGMLAHFCQHLACLALEEAM